MVYLSNLKKSKRELELTLVPIILKKMKLGNWPLHSIEIFNRVCKFIHISTYLIALITSLTFIPTFQVEVILDEYLDTDKLSKIKVMLYAQSFVKYNLKNPQLLVNRKKIVNTLMWTIILQEAKNNLESILFKIWVVEWVSTIEGRYIAGIDKQVFRVVLRSPRSVSEALWLLEPLCSKLKRVIILSQDKLDQVIRRKGLNYLNVREKFRRFLKSKQGKVYVRHCKVWRFVVYFYIFTDLVIILKNKSHWYFKLKY